MNDIDSKNVNTTTALSEKGRNFWHSPFFRVVFYFMLAGTAGWLLVRFLPGLAETLGVINQETGTWLSELRGGEEAMHSRRWLGDVPSLRGAILITVFSMLGGIVFALPVAWVYTVTKQAQGYDKSLVQMIIILPIAVAGVVLVVFGNLALAFALAGIVAGVRFRTTLDDVKDAVFAFIAIAIGLAAGIQAFTVAAGLSLIFCLVVLGLWKLKIGNYYADLERTGVKVPLSEALAPTHKEPALAVGDQELIEALGPDQLENVAERIARLERRLELNAQLKKKKRYQHLLLVHASDAEKAQDTVGDVLDDFTKRWRLVDIAPATEEQAWTLEYLVRLKNIIEPADFVETLKTKGEPEVRAIELKSLKGLNGKTNGAVKN